MCFRGQGFISDDGTLRSFRCRINMEEAHMISNQILQSTIDGMSEISGVDFCVVDTSGNALVATGEKINVDLAQFIASGDMAKTVKDRHFFKIYDEHQLEYVLVSIGGRDAFIAGKMTAFDIEGLLVAYKERFDRDNFIKNLLLDNLLLIDIYNRAKKLHVATDVNRCVFIVETSNEKDTTDLETVKGFFSGKSKDFVTAVDERNIIIVKELAPGEGYAELDKVARTVLDLFSNYPPGDVHIAYGTIVGDIKEVSHSYKEARMALDVGKIFYNEKYVIAYSALGIGRLIYQLPIPLCKMFIKEILDGKTPDDFDEETLVTISKFFENNLNVSETSRQLYIHRNTLVYRLDKLQKSTGLDLRVFEDAITFKIALMVVKYMKYMESMDY